MKAGRMVALLFVHHSEAKAWTPDEITAAGDVCERLWSAVERAHAEAERERAEQLREAQTRVLETALLDTSLPDALETLVRTVEGLSRSGLLASVLLLDEDGAHLRHGAGPSLPSAYNAAIDGIAVGPNVGSCGTAVHLKEPVYVADIAHDPLGPISATWPSRTSFAPAGRRRSSRPRARCSAPSPCTTVSRASPREPT